MKALNLLIIFFLIFPATLFSQVEEELESEDYIEYLKNRSDQVIKPLGYKKFSWEDWESNLNPEEKLALLKRYSGNEIINFILYQDDTLDINPADVHFIDLNNDGIEDVIYESYYSQYQGHESKYLLGTGDNFKFIRQFSGKIIAMDSVSGTFTIHNYPCCDGYIHEIAIYQVLEDGTPTLLKKELFLQSNVAKVNNFPDSLQYLGDMELNNKAVLYYHGHNKVYEKFEPEEIKYSDNTINMKPLNYYPFAIIPEGSPVKILAEKKAGESKYYFIKVNINDLSVEAIQELQNNLELDKDVLTSIYGWVFVE